MFHPTFFLQFNYRGHFDWPESEAKKPQPLEKKEDVNGIKSYAVAMVTTTSHSYRITSWCDFPVGCCIQINDLTIAIKEKLRVFASAPIIKSHENDKKKYDEHL